MDIKERAIENLRATVRLAIGHQEGAPTLLVYDSRSVLSRIVSDAYKAVVPEAVAIDFDTVDESVVRMAILGCQAGSLAILVQSSNFRLNEFRLRIELFQRGVKTIEHIHLERMKMNEHETYIDGLAYDPNYYRPLGNSLKVRMDTASHFVVESGENSVLTYETGLESAKLNTGDYALMKNIGGTFPIGEVFSEPKDLTAVNGEVTLQAFAGTDFLMRFPEPFKIQVDKGVVSVGDDAPEEFKKIVELVTLDEAPTLREFGLGLNRAFSPKTPVSDITAFERMKGMHMSMGGKHTVYKKPGFRTKFARYHVDVFVATKRILADGKPLFENGEYTLE